MDLRLLNRGNSRFRHCHRFFRDVKESLGHDSTDESNIELRPLGPTFTDWLEYKRERLPRFLDELDDRGEWPA